MAGDYRDRPQRWQQMPVQRWKQLHWVTVGGVLASDHLLMHCGKELEAALVRQFDGDANILRLLQIVPLFLTKIFTLLFGAYPEIDEESLR